MKHLPIVMLLLILIFYRPIGDINGDYNITTTDLVIIQQHNQRTRDLTLIQFYRADLNRDYKVDKYDLKILFTILANK